jgi:hypothetical protein
VIVAIEQRILILVPHRRHLPLLVGLRLWQEHFYLSFTRCKFIQLTRLPLSQLEQLFLDDLILYLIIILFHKSILLALQPLLRLILSSRQTLW